MKKLLNLDPFFAVEKEDVVIIDTETPLFKLFEVSSDESESPHVRMTAGQELLHRMEKLPHIDPARIDIEKYFQESDWI